MRRTCISTANGWLKEYDSLEILLEKNPSSFERSKFSNMKRKRFCIVSVVLIFLLMLTVMLCLGWGSYKIGFQDLKNILIGNGSSMQNTAIFQIRLPRILVGMLVGIALSMAGGVLQTVTKNELADSGMIGINAGAALAAVLFLSFQTKNYYNKLGDFSIYVLPIMAVLGAMISAVCIYGFSVQGKAIKPKRLLLVGIGMNIGLNAIISFFTFQSGTSDYNRILTWTTGSLWGTSWAYVKPIAILVLVVSVLVFYEHKTMDVLNLSDELAIGLGVSIQKQRKKLLIYAVILAGGATAFAGNIGFLGLICPHIARRLVGSFHKYFLVVSCLISMIIILLADSISRTLFSPIELPVGIMISILGVPYFLYLMIRQ